MIRMPRNRAAGLLAAACTIGLLVGAASACDVPVFRWALERWVPSPYEVVIFHRGELAPSDANVVGALTDCARDANAPANVYVRPVDVDGNMPEHVEPLWEAHKDAELPRVVAAYPRRWGPPRQAWAGDLSAENVRHLLDSPVRREIYKQIIDGKTAVWVLLESGDATKDANAFATLDARLKLLEKELKLPEQPPAPTPGSGWDELAPTGPPLEIDFSLLRLKRSAEGEGTFVELLLNTEDDLRKEYNDEPMAFAFFGQGRVLPVLVGKGINPDNLDEFCYFLTGRCSCEVKEMNPGVDLLFTANWYAAFDDAEPRTVSLPGPLAPPEALAGDANADAKAAAALDTPPPTPPSTGMSPLTMALIAVGVAVLALAGGLVVWVLRKPQTA